MRKFKVSRQAVHRHLSNLIEQGLVLKQGSSRHTAFYILNTPKAKRKALGRARQFHKRMRVKGASEDLVLDDVEAQAGLLAGISKNAQANFRYAFTEMVNNAIDHSGSALFEVDLHIDASTCVFTVRDTGVGVFANIRKEFGLGSEMEAIEHLLKGKQTTQPKRHSGEGIFFTSKIAERFVIDSHKKRFVVDNRIDDIFIDDRRQLKGTKVTVEVDVHSSRNLADLFREYTSESFAFDKTKVTVKLFESGESYISRSQAKRLVHSLEKFKEIVLDFSGVETVGQAFADEVFRVFQDAHPDITIAPINMHENVEFMVRRAPGVRKT